LAKRCPHPGLGAVQTEVSKGDMNNSMARARVCRFFQPKSDGSLNCIWAKLRTFSELTIVFAALIFLSGCSGSGGPGISVQITPDTASVDQGQTLSFTASLTNDLRNQGVTWSLSGSSCSGLTGAGTSGCGNLSSVSTSAVTYTAPSGLSSSLSVTLTATSIANANDTKTATITVELPLTFSTTSPLPNGSNGVPYSQSLVVTGGVTPIKFSLASGSAGLPAGLQLNQSGTITGKPSGPVSGQPNPSVFTVQVTDDSTTPVSATQQFSIYVSPAPALAITAISPLQTGFVNYPYNTFISTTGGVTPFTWTLFSGTLPPGLAFNTTTGQITGTPTTASSTPYAFTLQVADSTLPASQVVQKALSISIQTPQPLSISPASLPAGQTAAPYSAALSASGGIPPYSWAVTSGQLPQGLHFNTATGAITGTPILVTNSTFSVQVSDSEETPATLSAAYSISIAAGTSNDSLVSGEYSFLFQGFDSDGAVAIAGSLVTDGNGKITAGFLDSNRMSGVVSRAALLGTYSVGTDGRGTMEMVATNNVGVALALDFNLALDSKGNIHFFEDNSTTTNTDPKKTHGIGIMKPVTQSFAAGSFSGNYAFLFTGTDMAGSATALGGVVHADGVGNITTNGSGTNGDYNEAGTFSPQLQISGGFSFDSGTHGVSSLTFELPGKSAYTLTYSFDFVSPSDIFFVGVDTTDATHPRLSGEMILQSTNTAFNSSALNGPSIATGTGLSSKNASVFAGLLTPVPSNTPNCTAQVANCVTLNYDENNGGAVASPSLIGNYQISANGRVAFTFSSVSGGQLTAVSAPRMAVAYLFGRGQGFTMGSDTAVTTGLLEQQETGVTFAASSITGDYSLSSAFPAENQVENVIGETTASGTGSILGTIDTLTPPPASSLTQSSTPNLGQSLVANYANISSGGRGTLTTNSPIGFPTNLALYIVSPGSFRAISLDPNDQNPEVFFFDH
jgi:large repetitive protein